MDVYRQAAAVIEKVRNGQGTAKALCLEKQMQKKKQTYAVACETLRRFDAISRILTMSKFFDFFPLVEKHLAMVLTYDLCFGPGVKTRQHPAAIAVVQSTQYLMEALKQIEGDYPGIYTKHKIEDIEQEGDSSTEPASRTRAAGLRIPTYVRVNTLVPEVTTEGVLHYFKKRQEQPADGAEESETFVPSVRLDKHVPNLIVLPPRIDLHKAKLFRSGSVVIQDKASCLPPCVLLGAVPVVAPPQSQFAANPTLRKLVDACAAPGNKTSQLAALSVAQLGPDSVKIHACEMDARRAATLRDRLTFLHADSFVTVVEGDFTEMDNKIRSRAEGVLLDPSCSASGMIKRIDVSAPNTSAPADGEEGAEGGAAGVVDQSRRVEHLARMQEKLLVSALTCFPRARRVVYSTCSIHERENEEVVRRALADEAIKACWALANIMPDTWATRGLPTPDGPQTEFTIRCNPEADLTNGFFVACFDRVAASKEM